MKTRIQARQLALGLAFSVTDEEPVASDAVAPAIDSSFPIAQADALARLESFNKHYFRPNTYLHKWWARRPGTTFRYILKQLVADPHRRDYYHAGGLEGQIILDPMLGGGTTLHEAIRLGASVIGFDIDPIPTLQAQATLTHIPLTERQAVFSQFFENLAARLAPLFQTQCPICQAGCETQFLLYALRKKCNCGEALFVDSFLLREESNGSTIKLSPDQHQVSSTSDVVAPVQGPLYEKTVRVCPNCGEPFQHLKDVRFAERYVPIVVLSACDRHGLFFKPADASDLKMLKKARQLRVKLTLPSSGLAIPSGPKSDDLLNKGVRSFGDLFTDRQLIYLATCKELLDQVEDKHRLWLALLISTSLEFNSILCGYKGADKQRAGAIRHVFSHHAYSLPHTALENNPVFSKNSSGTLGLLFADRIESASEWAEAPVERQPSAKGWAKINVSGELDGGHAVETPELLRDSLRAFFVRQQDSSKMPLSNQSVDYIVTDPPYFDSVQYSDLAHFFHAWLRWLLPGRANWDYEQSASAVAETDQDGSKYERVLSGIWSECHRVLKPNGRLVFTFHHWNPDAWARLTISLRRGGFRLVNSFTISSENPTSVHIRQLKALKHDCILVLCPREISSQAHVYSRMDTVRQDNSFDFCSDCARLLGYCLETDLEDETIIKLWRSSLGK
ncbi:MAG: DNA methyltransferase [Anaerolineae bacterium]